MMISDTDVPMSNAEVLRSAFDALNRRDIDGRTRLMASLLSRRPPTSTARSSQYAMRSRPLRFRERRSAPRVGSSFGGRRGGSSRSSVLSAFDRDDLPVHVAGWISIRAPGAEEFDRIGDPVAAGVGVTTTVEACRCRPGGELLPEPRTQRG
jgi:hypothetical protein